MSGQERRNPGNLAVEPGIVPGSRVSSLPDDIEMSNLVWSQCRLAHPIGRNRLKSYLEDCNGCLKKALVLYDWNTRASAAIMQTIAMVEVICRNAFDRELTIWAQNRNYQSWFDSAPLDNQAISDISKATRRATQKGFSVDSHGGTIAELTFGFWRYLAAPRYHSSLWVPQLHNAFPFGHADLRERRIQVESYLTRLNLVRNRAAHHEPIHRRNLLHDYETAVELVSWISPDAGAWVAARSMIPQVVAEKPSYPPDMRCEPLRYGQGNELGR